LFNGFLNFCVLKQEFLSDFGGGTFFKKCMLMNFKKLKNKAENGMPQGMQDL
jgi:hypothetical protein